MARLLAAGAGDRGTACVGPRGECTVSDQAILAAIAGQEWRWRGYDWRLIPAVPQRPLINMALDEVLTLRVGRGLRPPTLRIWGWANRCVVLGRFQSVKNEV